MGLSATLSYAHAQVQERYFLCTVMSAPCSKLKFFRRYPTLQSYFILLTRTYIHPCCCPIRCSLQHETERFRNRGIQKPDVSNCISGLCKFIHQGQPGFVKSQLQYHPLILKIYRNLQLMAQKSNFSFAKIRYSAITIAYSLYICCLTYTFRNHVLTAF